MNTKLLMTSSAVFKGLTGIALSFIPDEIIAALRQVSNELSTISLQLTGALYFGFAMTNWMSKGVLIGGIYSRPVCMGNFLHFFIASLAILKVLLKNNTPSIFISLLAIIYIIFAIMFGYVLFTHPIKTQSN